MQIFSNPNFWLQIIFIYTLTFGIRFLERAVIWLYRPNDSMVLSEMEALDLREGDGEARRERLVQLGHTQVELGHSQRGLSQSPLRVHENL